MSISRRRFLEGTALGGIAAGVSDAAKIDKDHKLPTRVLGKTGARVSILAFGGGSRFLMYKDEDKALEAVNRALDLGITYMDTAYGYGNGLSEERIGKVMKTRRKGIFVATKINKRSGDEAMRVLEGSLKRLQIDQIDLIHIHSPDRRRRSGGDRGQGRRARDSAEAARSEGDALHRHHQPLRSGGAGEGARAARFRLHPDGAQRARWSE